jgi:uncharacterized 2Fe-2S/4Fe-4S cluster protein (DUF4445 family)
MKIRFQPSGVRVEIESGKTLLDAAIAGGIEIESVCGGRGTCAKCKVVATDGLSALTALERRGLSEDELARGYRLACQAVIEADVDVIIPEESRLSRVSILAQGVQGALQIEPWVHKWLLQVPPTTLEEQLPDWANVMRAWASRFPDGRPCPQPTLRALRQLPTALRERNGLISLVEIEDLGESRLVRIEAGEAPERLLGIAFDIGTTTVVGYLLDLESGEQLAVSSLLNPQTRYGDDVVSRIDYAARHPEGLETLRSEIVAALNRIVAATTATAAVSASDVLAMTVVGNTTMQHLFLGVSPTALGQAPYVPAVTQALCLHAGDLGIAIDPEASICVLPNIAGWVGADTVGVILSTGVHKQQDMALAIDIGTNGEMALGSVQRLVTCSTAAGPAFEGAHLSCGMRASDGAIDAVEIDSDVHWHVIGSSAPRGLCGSGLVDAVAEMLGAGILDGTGMMLDQEAMARRSDGHVKLAGCISGAGAQRRFELVGAGQGAVGRPVAITQRDVRELQLAKGAIRAGIEILMKELGIGVEDVRHVYLAGAFGNYIRPQSALGIGLIPRFPNAEFLPVGNAAGSGAKMALLSKSARDETGEIVARAEYLELSARLDFQAEFAEAMIFEW